MACLPRERSTSISRDAALGSHALRYTDTRALAATRARRVLDGFVLDRQRRRFNVQAIVGLAFGGQPFTRLPNHLFKHRHAKRGPQGIAISLAQPRLPRPPQDDDRVRQRRNAAARQLLQLLERAGHRSRRERRSILLPAVAKNTQGAAFESVLMKPGHQDRRTRRGVDGVHKRVTPSIAE